MKKAKISEKSRNKNQLTLIPVCNKNHFVPKFSYKKCVFLETEKLLLKTRVHYNVRYKFLFLLS